MFSILALLECTPSLHFAFNTLPSILARLPNTLALATVFGTLHIGTVVDVGGTTVWDQLVEEPSGFALRIGHGARLRPFVCCGLS